jgi:hypothetical protein
MGFSCHLSNGPEGCLPNSNKIRSLIVGLQVLMKPPRRICCTVVRLEEWKYSKKDAHKWMYQSLVLSEGKYATSIGEVSSKLYECNGREVMACWLVSILPPGSSGLESALWAGFSWQVDSVQCSMQIKPEVASQGGAKSAKHCSMDVIMARPCPHPLLIRMWRASSDVSSRP